MEILARRAPNYNPDIVPATVADQMLRCVEQCSKLLELYSDSKWVDDAILLMGKAFYHRQDYLQAHIEFKELTSIFDQSELVPEANYWWGMTLIRLRRFEEATEQLGLAIQNSKEKKIRNSALLATAEILEVDDQLEEAIAAYRNVARDADDKGTKVIAQLRVGDLLAELEQHAEAEKAYAVVEAMGPGRSAKFLGEFGRAIAAKNLGRFEEAVPVFEKLLGSGTNSHMYADIRYEIADALYQQDQREDALFAFEEVATIYPNTDGAARGLFRFAEIKFYEERDWTKAHEFYSRAFSISSRLEEIHNISETRRNQLQKLMVVQRRINNRLAAQAKQDSTGEMADSTRVRLERRREKFAHRLDPPPVLEDSLADDSTAVAAQSAPAVRAPVVARPPVDPAMVRLNAEALDRYMAAEIFLNDLEVADTALVYLKDIGDNYFDTKVADRALYLTAQIYRDHRDDAERAAELYHYLIADYSDSEFANLSRERVGLDRVNSVNDSLVALLDAVESKFHDFDTQKEAIALYEDILASHSDVACLSRVHYMLGLYYEHYARAPKLAYEHYDAIIQQFPMSPMVVKLRPRVTTYMNWEKQQLKDIQTLELDAAKFRKADSLRAVRAAELAPRGAPSPAVIVAMDSSAVAQDSLQAATVPPDTSATQGAVVAPDTAATPIPQAATPVPPAASADTAATMTAAAQPDTTPASQPTVTESASPPENREVPVAPAVNTARVRQARQTAGTQPNVAPKDGTPPPPQDTEKTPASPPAHP